MSRDYSISRLEPVLIFFINTQIILIENLIEQGSDLISLAVLNDPIIIFAEIEVDRPKTTT